MAWTKGKSGNPSGRPKGIMTAARRQINLALENATPGALAKVIELAKDGDLDALKIILDRGMPIRGFIKSYVDIQIPESLDTIHDIKDFSQDILRKVEDQTLATEEAQPVFEMIKMYKETVMTAELEQRVSALEEEIKVNKNSF